MLQRELILVELRRYGKSVYTDNLYSKTLDSIRPGVCVPLAANLTTAQGCKDLAAEIAKRESKVDVLVNNSGVSWGSKMEETDEVKGWDRVFDV